MGNDTTYPQRIAKNEWENVHKNALLNLKKKTTAYQAELISIL